jgi:hypothetical protein
MVLPAPLQLNSLQSSRSTGGLSSGESTTRTWIHLPIIRTARTTLRPPMKNDPFFGHYGLRTLVAVRARLGLCAAGIVSWGTA